MDTRTLEAQRNQAEAEVIRARENLSAAQANVKLRQSEQLLAQQELKRSRHCSIAVSPAADHRPTAVTLRHRQRGCYCGPRTGVRRRRRPLALHRRKWLS
ncbi:hypothetical protein FHR69_005310 [Pseudomonas umsongensis]|uniref:Uncharacterized protein n=1 Tax=Pseudomonas umsongensis TaxID=198618 RepID=A0ACC5MKA6_9PSED|nr:hypothetical protein [Pseudomonas umsongensis]